MHTQQTTVAVSPKTARLLKQTARLGRVRAACEERAFQTAQALNALAERDEWTLERADALHAAAERAQDSFHRAHNMFMWHAKEIAWSVTEAANA